MRESVSKDSVMLGKYFLNLQESYMITSLGFGSAVLLYGSLAIAMLLVAKDLGAYGLMFLMFLT